ncbi:hypothetical protein [Streptomyces sp. NPDC059247]|uniref:hypothetical protein n=1 Tax=Streptomyces sp. NPDC059247 TaxID=3346790 RepID=UPI0036CF4FA1
MPTMLAVEDLTQQAVRAFVYALNTRDGEIMHHTVHRGFSFTVKALRQSGGIKQLMSSEALLAVAAQSDDGLTLAGAMKYAPFTQTLPARWVFTTDGDDRVLSLTVDDQAELTDEQREEANGAVEELEKQATAAVYARVRDDDGRTHLPGTARRRKIGSVPYLHAWKPGALGAISWINTGTKLEDPEVFKSFASPESGDSVRKSASSRVDFRLSLVLGWDGDDYQKAVVTLDATSYFKDGTSILDFGTWIKEKHGLVDRAVPRVTGTLTLTGSDGVVISTEEITAKGVKPPYPMSFTREYALAGLPAGRYTVALTGAVKTGGFQFSGDDSTVDMDDRSITFDVGA